MRLNSIKIASPCPAKWDAMEKTDSPNARHCELCRKNVYDISGMTTKEAKDLFRGATQGEDLPCVRLYRRPDGTVLTADCPVGLRARVSRRLAKAAAFFVGIFAIGASQTSCSSTEAPEHSGYALAGRPSFPTAHDCGDASPSGKNPVSPHASGKNFGYLGGITIAPTPWWKFWDR